MSLINGFAPSAGGTFEILTAAGGISGTFANELLPALTDNLFWNVNYGANSVRLEVAAPSLLGDYNENSVLDAADYTIWRDTLGATANLAADGDCSGTIDAGDYNVWKTNFGSAAPTAEIGATAVHEPSTWCFALVVFGAAMRFKLNRRY